MGRLETLIVHGPVYGGHTTPFYAAPETWLCGADFTPDARTDLYSLGIVAYEVITGVQPFPCDDLEALKKAILNEKRPSVLDVTRHVSHDIDAWIRQVMALHPRYRYANATEALAALNTAIEKSPEAKPYLPIPDLSPHKDHDIDLMDEVDMYDHDEVAGDEDAATYDDSVEVCGEDGYITPEPKPFKKATRPRTKPAGTVAYVSGTEKIKATKQASLCLLDGPDKGRRILIPSKGITLGRAELNPKDNKISSIHFRAIIRGPYLIVEDQGSINGLIVGSIRKRSVKLTNNEQFIVGSTTLQFKKEHML